MSSSLFTQVVREPAGGRPRGAVNYDRVAIDAPDGRAKDIRSYQWAFDMADAGDLDYAHKLGKDAYDREQ
ncbi:MAG: hypothetical protein WKF65_08640 [Gaiellaceae bacterium]